MECIFCKIVNRTVKAHIFWESDTHLAFLSIYPNTKGVSVVIPKVHYPSYAFNLEDKALSDLILASKKVSKIIDHAFEDVGRTALVLEGFGVDHVHAKLFPLHGTPSSSDEWRPIKSSENRYFQKYEGFISSHDGDLEQECELEKVANLLKLPF